METITFNNDIRVMYVIARSFPDGIADAHRKLHGMVPFTTTRKYFGISRPENGAAIVYKAAAEELSPGEAAKLKCDTMIVKKGKYATITLKDYMKDFSRIGDAFQQLLNHPNLDPGGYCLEWYINEKDVRCMVPIIAEQEHVK